MGIREDEKIAPHCEFIHVHDKVVKQVMDVMPEGEELQNLAEFSGSSEIPRGSGSCMRSASRSYVCAILQVFSEWDSLRSPTSFGS